MQLYLRGLFARGEVYSNILRKRATTPKKLVVDFSSPNIAKQFHVGNLRSTLLGNFFCKISRLAGHEVVTVNYLGDWGSQFGLLAAYWPGSKRRQEFNQLPADVPLSQQLHILQLAYVEAVAKAKADPDFKASRALPLLKQMEEALVFGGRDSPVLSLWYAIRKLSTQYLHDFYARLRIDFDVYDAESEHVAEARRLNESIISTGKAEQTTDGLWIVRNRDQSGYMVLKKTDGTTLYLSREVAATIQRDKVHQADEYVYVVDRAQARHFHHLQHLLKVLGQDELSQKVHHMGFGRVVGMSTRQGKVETVEQILVDGDKAAEKYIRKSKTMKVAEEEIPEVRRELAETALFLNDLKRNKNQEFVFNFRDIFKANSPFIIQEKYARLTSLIDNNEGLMTELSRVMESDAQSSNLLVDDEPNIRLLCQCLYELDASLFQSFLNSETSPLFAYLCRLSSRVGGAMATARVKDEPERDVALSRLLVFVSARNVLEEGLDLLGLKPLPRI